jgi:hypothetical protein
MTADKWTPLGMKVPSDRVKSFVVTRSMLAAGKDGSISHYSVLVFQMAVMDVTYRLHRD